MSLRYAYSIPLHRHSYTLNHAPANELARSTPLRRVSAAAALANEMEARPLHAVRQADSRTRPVNCCPEGSCCLTVGFRKSSPTMELVQVIDIFDDREFLTQPVSETKTHDIMKAPCAGVGM